MDNEYTLYVMPCHVRLFYIVLHLVLKGIMPKDNKELEPI